jgi:hypothetical protein
VKIADGVDVAAEHMRARRDAVVAAPVAKPTGYTSSAARTSSSSRRRRAGGASPPGSGSRRYRTTRSR